MPPSVMPQSPVLLVCGEDEFAVKQRAREVFQQWCETAGGSDHERIDASVNNSGEALKALARLRESLQTLPFFGGAQGDLAAKTAIFSVRSGPLPPPSLPKPWGIGPGTQILPLG